MLSRLIPSSRSFVPRVFSAFSSSALRPVLRSSALSIRSFSATAAVAPKSVYITNEALLNAMHELRVQSTSWPTEKAAAVDKELNEAQKTGGDAAALAVAQKHILQRTTFSDIVQKFGGWYPLIGLTAVTALSKELILFNEELWLVSNFAFVFSALYFNFSDTVVQAYEADRNAYAKAQKDVRELDIDSKKALISAYEKNPLVHSMLKDLKTEYNPLFDKKVKVTFARQRVAAHAAVNKKLEDIFAREMEEELRIRSHIQKASTAYVLQKFASLPAAQKTMTLDHAIERFGGAKADLKKDPVRQLYLEYFKSKEWEKKSPKKL